MSFSVTEISTDVPFMGHYVINDLTICNSVVDYWAKSTPVEGKMYGASGDSVVNKEIKDSLDVYITPSTNRDVGIDNYIGALESCLDLYLKKYDVLNYNVSKWRIVEDINIQYYPPGGGFKTWHCERASSQAPYGNRLLVFMTYLNDVEEDNCTGGTEWLYQNLKLPAKKGHTLIWPVDWMFTHRGIVASKTEKYIITGWYSFIT